MNTGHKKQRLTQVVPPPATLGGYLRWARQALGYSQGEVAALVSRRVPMSREYVCTIERGRQGEIGYRKLAALAEVLNVPLEEVLLRTGTVLFKPRTLPREQPRSLVDNLIPAAAPLTVVSTHLAQIYDSLPPAGQQTLREVAALLYQELAERG